MLKNLKYILYLLFGLGIVLTVLFFINQDGFLDSYMYYAYILLGIGIVLAVILPLFGASQNPQSLKKAGLALLLAAVLVVITYLLASGDAVPVNLEVEPSELTYKLTDAGIILTYILLAISFIAIIAGSAIKTIRDR